MNDEKETQTLEEKLEDLTSDIESLKESTQPLQQKLNEAQQTLNQINQTKSQVDTSWTSIEGINQEIDDYKLKLLVGDEEAESVKSLVNKTVTSINNASQTAQSKLTSIESVVSKLEKQTSDLSQIKSQLDELTKEATKFLESVTDGSTYTTYSKQAKKYERTANMYGIASFLSLLAVAGYIFNFGYDILQTDENGLPFLSNLRHWDFMWLATQKGVVIAALFVAFWSTNKSKHINTKLGAEYRYKASLAESILGYRNTHKLAYGDEEYQTLFAQLTAQLVRNPSDTIDGFFSDQDKTSSTNFIIPEIFKRKKKKSPQETEEPEVTN